MRALLAPLFLVLVACDPAVERPPCQAPTGEEGDLSCGSASGVPSTWIQRCEGDEWVEVTACDYVHGYFCLSCTNGHDPVCATNDNPSWCE